MATIVGSGTGGNWSATAAWVGGVVPGASDDVQLTVASAAITIDTSAAACRSLDCTGYTNTLTHTAGVTFNIGDATAGLSNIALKLVSGMTYTLGNATTSAIGFVTTSATVQTVDFAGKTSGNVTYNAASNGSWQMVGTHNTGTTATVTLTKGTLDANGQTCSWGLFSSSNANTRTLTLGAANITLTGTSTVWDMATATSLTVSAASSTITCTGSGISFHGGSNKTYGTLNLTGAGTATWNATGAAATTFNRTGTATKTDALLINGSKTVTGTLTLAGNSVTNRLLVESNAVGTSVSITNTGATMTWSNVDFMDIALGTAFDASAITGKSGDCGGNSNITFTTSVGQTWSGTSGGNWSANAWTTRVPLPQDDVTINAAFSATQTVTSDMPRLGRSIDWTSATGSPTWAFGSTANTIFGSLTLISGMTISGTQITTFAGRSSYNITSAGRTFTQAITINAPSGTYTQQDALNTAGTLLVSAGTYTTNNNTLTCLIYNLSGATVVANMGSSTINLTSTAVATVINIGSSATINAGTSQFVIANASANTRTIQCTGRTLATITYTVAGSTGALVMTTGGSTIDTFNFSDASNARTVTFTAGQTYTFTTAFNVQGTSGKLMTVNSSTPGTSYTFSKASGYVSCDYMSLQDSTATGGASWYAGYNTTNVSNNSGWFFTVANPAGFLSFMRR